MFMKDKNDKFSSLYCSCGCGNGIVLKKESNDFFNCCELMLVSDTYYLTQEKNMWTRLKEKIKRIYHILYNKEYCYFSICIDNQEDLEEFKKFVSEIKL